MITKNKIIKIIELAKKCNECALHHFKKFDNLARQYENATESFSYIKLRDLLCIGDLCGQRTLDGTKIWIDKFGHITDKASRTLSNELINQTQ